MSSGQGPEPAEQAFATLKSNLRAQAMAHRPPPDPQAAQALAHLVLTHIPLPHTIAGTWPLPGELDLRPLLHALHARGHRIVLPQTPPRGQPLIFRTWTPTTRMLPERFGTQYPDGPNQAPDMFLVPLLAFDRSGNRLGYGGGYYDRTLAGLPGRPAIGVGYAAQEIPAVPAEAHDRRLDAIVTEVEVIWTGKEAVLF